MGTMLLEQEKSKKMRTDAGVLRVMVRTLYAE